MWAVAAVVSGVVGFLAPVLVLAVQLPWHLVGRVVAFG